MTVFFFVLMCGGVINKDAMNKQTEILVQTDGMNSERCGLAAQTLRIFFFFFFYLQTNCEVLSKFTS